jgi:hypothetical protein
MKADFNIPLMAAEETLGVCNCVIISVLFLALQTERKKERKYALLLGARRPKDREEWKSSIFSGLQHGMSLLIHDVVALLYDASSKEEINGSQCLH